MTKESEIEAYLVRQVKAAGGEVRKCTWVGRRGAPDRLVMLQGRAAAYVELKAPGKLPSLAQVREHARLRELGQNVVVIDSTAGVDALLMGAGL
jgi:hypothetical protein